MSKAWCKTTIKSGVSLEASSLLLRGRRKVVYILPSSDSALALLLMEFIEYDDDHVVYDLEWVKLKKLVKKGTSQATCKSPKVSFLLSIQPSKLFLRKDFLLSIQPSKLFLRKDLLL
ncbi:hypothetical protein Hanom_Chr01g00084171 [Helianthus anomalus]